VRFRKLDADHDPTDRDAACATVRHLQADREVVTGLLFVEEDAADMYALNQTVQAPLYDSPCEQFCPGCACIREVGPPRRSRAVTNLEASERRFRRGPGTFRTSSSVHEIRNGCEDASSA